MPVGRTHPTLLLPLRESARVLGGLAVYVPSAEVRVLTAVLGLAEWAMTRANLVVRKADKRAA